MEELFLQILNMSMMASIVIAAVILLRFPLKKAPKFISYSLWSVVLFRLVCPFSFESILSLLPSAKPLPQEILTAVIPVINSGIPLLDQAVRLPAPMVGDSINPMQVLLFIGAILWIVGVAALVIYSIVSYFRLKRKVSTALLVEGNIYECEAISSPFVLGIIKPKIYLPLGLSAIEREYILRHEQTHIKRLDTLVKPLAFFVLCIHWFNPLCWLSFVLMSKDMELSCDESVIKSMGSGIKQDYSTSLLTLATDRKLLGGSPLAFGESNVKSRIKNVLHYKKPAFWVILVAVIAVVAVSIGLMANPKSTQTLNEIENGLGAKQLAYLDAITINTPQGEVEITDRQELQRVTDFIKTTKLSKKELSKNRAPDRDSTNQIILSKTIDSSKYQSHINISADFSEVWYDNQIKPTFSYQLTDSVAVMRFIDAFYGSATPASYGSVPVTKPPEELTDDEIDTIGRNLFAQASTIFEQLYFFPEMLDRDETDSIEQDGSTWYRLTQFNSWEEYNAACEGVFSKGFCETYIYPAAQSHIMEQEGKLYQDPQRLGGSGGYFRLEANEQKIVAVTKSAVKMTLRANMKSLIYSDKDGTMSDGDLIYTLLAENGNWVLESFYGTTPDASNSPPVADSPYRLDIQKNGDLQLSISSTDEFPEFGEKNEGFAYYETATEQFHVRIITDLGQPTATEENPVGSLAGAEVEFDMDFTDGGKLVSSKFTEGGSAEKLKLEISEERLAEIGLRLFEITFLAKQKADADVQLTWAKALSAEEVKSIELIVEPSLESERYKKYAPNEFDDVINTIKNSKGEFLQYNETLEGRMQTFYVTMNDGVKHSVTNAGNVYLIIDGQFYQGDPALLKIWNFKGNAAVPTSFYLDSGPEEVITVKQGELHPDAFVAAIAKSFQIKEGVARFTIPKEKPSGYDLSALSIRVSGSMPTGEGANTTSLNPFEKETKEAKWQLGKEYSEKVLNLPIPKGTTLYLFTALTDEELNYQHSANSSKVFPLRDDSTTPSTKIDKNAVIFTDKFGDTLKLSLTLPKGWTMQVSDADSQYDPAPKVDIFSSSSLVGNISCSDFDLYRDENGDIPYMSVYNQIMMGSGGGWDGEYTPISSTKDRCTAVCKPWRRIDVPGVSGAALANAVDKGILSYDANLLKYVAIFLNDQSVTEQQLQSIAKSVKLSK